MPPADGRHTKMYFVSIADLCAAARGWREMTADPQCMSWRIWICHHILWVFRITRQPLDLVALAQQFSYQTVGTGICPVSTISSFVQEIQDGPQVINVGMASFNPIMASL